MTEKVTWAVALASLGASTYGGSALILNEYNCVSDTQTLENDTANDGGDVFFGHQQIGNGGNWVEFVVTQDHADLRGWQMIWSNADPDQGSIAFKDVPLWADVRAGTIITVREDDLAPPGYGLLPTNTGFNPSTNDWWIHINVDDATYLDQNGFKTDNDSWQMTIKDAGGSTVVGPIGEGLNSIGGWGGTGINSREVGASIENPSADTTGAAFQDLDYSTFGAPNHYNDPATGALVSTQNFDALRGWWINRLAGDANLDGQVDITDLATLATNWQSDGKDWFGADFTGEGTVDITDLALLATNWQVGVSMALSFEEALASVGLGGASVPEPALMGLALPLALLRRRRSGR